VKTTPEGELAKMRVELDVTPWWWTTPSASRAAAACAMAQALGAVPRAWRVTAASRYLSVSANITPDVTLEGLEKKRQEIVAMLDALVDRQERTG
jgi:hypothetical protein